MSDMANVNDSNKSVELTFSNFVMGLATAALSQLGIVEDPVTKEKGVNLVYARQHIDTLTMLSTKTKSNLTAEEDQLLGQILTDLRLRFVEVSSSENNQT